MSVAPAARAWLANHIGVLPPGLDVDELVRELNRRLRKPVPPETMLLVWFEDSNGALVPDGDGTRDIGSTALRVQSVFAEFEFNLQDPTNVLQATIKLNGIASTIFGSVSNHPMFLIVANTKTWGVDTNFHFFPDLTAVYDIGTSSKLVRKLYCKEQDWNGSNLIDTFGSGTPEGAIAADVGSTFRRSDGGAGTSFYVKETGTGNTGWVGK